MRRLLLAAACFCFVAGAAPAQPAPDLSQPLPEAFEVLHRVENEAAAAFAIDALCDPGLSDEFWQVLFLDQFDPSWFTPVLGRFWEHAVASSGEDQLRVTVLSAYCAAACVGRVVSAGGVEALAEVGGPVDEGLAWLQSIAPRLNPVAREAVLSYLARPLGEARGPLVDLAGGHPEANRTALQLGFVLATYAPEGESGTQLVGRLLQLPDLQRIFWESHGMFLFDGGELSPAQIESLDALVGLIPTELHRIVAFVVPDGTGIDPRQPGLNAPGQLVFLPLFPEDQMTDPSDFSRRAGQPVAPLFPIVAAQEIVRAVQAEQFRVRRDLVTRRDLVVNHAGKRQGQYLRKSIPPSRFVEQPDELLPSIAYMWFVDTRRTFRTALDYFGLDQRDPMDSFLLMADLLSGGGNTTPLFTTDELGGVVRNDVPIGRVRLSEVRVPRPDLFTATRDPVIANLVFVNRLVIDGAEWMFRFSEFGGTLGWTRR